MFKDNYNLRIECESCKELVFGLVGHYEKLIPYGFGDIEDVDNFINLKMKTYHKLFSCSEHCHECKLLSFRNIGMKCDTHTLEEYRPERFSEYRKSKGIYSYIEKAEFNKIKNIEMKYINSLKSKTCQGRSIPHQYKTYMIPKHELPGHILNLKNKYMNLK